MIVRPYTSGRVNVQSCARCFSTTPSCSIPPKANALKLLPENVSPPPPYPYGHSHFYKQRNYGLYAGAMIQFGNNVAPKSGVKTRRRWHPNIVHKQLYSRALDKPLRLKVRTRVLRTIDKVGGLDEYLLGATSARLKELGEEGWRLRWALLQTPSIQERLKEDYRFRKAVGAVGQPTVAAATLQEAAAEARVIDGDTVEEVVEDDSDLSEVEVEERLRQHFEEETHMREEAPPRTLWQRFTGMFRRS